MITPKKVIEIASYLTPIHHVKGRIRVRVNPKIKEQSKDITIDDIQSMPQKIEGIKGIKINKVVGSITVTYDHNIFPFELWEDLLAQKNTQNISELLNNLAKEVI